MDVVSHPLFASLHPTGSHPESSRRLAVLHERFALCRVRAGDARRTCCAATRRRFSSAYGRSAAGSTPTRSAPRRPTRRRCSRRARRSRRCGAAASRSRGRPATTRGRDRRWASASSTRSRSPRAGRRPSSASGASRSSTGTSTTETARRTSSATTRRSSSSSLHQWPFYPGTGGPDEQGETLLNIPLAAGTGDDAYLAAFDAAESAIAAFEPELLLVSAGFDAHVDDPLAELRADSTDAFRELARRASRLAPRVAAVLEGGYNLETLPGLVAAALDGFSGETPSALR